MPEPTAPAELEGLFGSLVGELASSKAALEEFTKVKFDDRKAQLTQLYDQQRDLIERGDPEKDPFRAQQRVINQNLIDVAESESKTLQKNLDIKHGLVDRLEALLTEGQSAIQQMKGVTGLAAIRNPRIQKAIEDVAMEATIIEAVLKARDGEIDTAYKIIDKGLAAVAADRTDRINYLNTLLEFEGDKFAAFTAVEKEFMDAQIKLLETDVDNARANVEEFKKAFIDPDTAKLYHDSGITFFDTLEERNRKLVKQQEINLAKGYNAAGTIKVVGTANNVMTDNERSLLTTFKGEPIVKDYNSILAKKLSVDAIIRLGVGGPGDLTLVYEFMRGLDPNSVVRETEYATAAKSGNIFKGLYAQFNGYFKESGGFMPPSTAKAFQDIVNSKFEVQSQLYGNLAQQYRDIAKRQGLNPDNVVPGYSAIAPQSGGPSLGELPPIDSDITEGIGDNVTFFGGLLNLFK